MPQIVVEFLSERSFAEKEALVETLTQSMIDECGVRREDVSVSIKDVANLQRASQAPSCDPTKQRQQAESGENGTRKS